MYQIMCESAKDKMKKCLDELLDATKMIINDGEKELRWR